MTRVVGLEITLLTLFLTRGFRMAVPLAVRTRSGGCSCRPRGPA